MTDAAADMGARVTFSSLCMHYFTCSIAPVPQRYNKDVMVKLADFKVICGLFHFRPKNMGFLSAPAETRSFPLTVDG
jgi:hypothetical protein